METMDCVAFNDILQSAEQLTAEIEPRSELPRIHRSLRHVLEAGNSLLNRKDLTTFSPAQAEHRATFFLGTKGVDASGFKRSLEPFYLGGKDEGEAPPEVDVDLYLKKERKAAMFSIIESSSNQYMQSVLESINGQISDEWTNEHNAILTFLSGSLGEVEIEKSEPQRKGDHVSLLSQSEITFTHEVDKYNKAVINNIPKGDLLEKFLTAANNSGHSNIREMWAAVSSLLGGIVLDSGDNIALRRGHASFVKQMLTRSRKYLEESFFSKLKSEVWGSLGTTRMGGAPSVITLIKSYANLKSIVALPGVDIGTGDSGPVWAIVYFCLRCGKAGEAAKYLREIGILELAKYVDEYAAASASVLPYELENKVRMEYRRVVKSNCRDDFKRAVYCILGACDVALDHSEIATRLDDYIWIKLSKIRDNADKRYANDFMTMDMFQNLILEKYGESYFDAQKQPFVYFQALALTAQFEAAIEFITRNSELRYHAIHLALALHENGLLLISGRRSRSLHRKETDPPGLRRVNFIQMILNYSKGLQSTNARDAINYLYFLRNVKDDAESDVFTQSVCNMILQSREFHLFGVMNDDGCRVPGLLETMGLDVQPLIVFAAKESLNKGLMDDAVILYDLAGMHDDSLRILNRILCLHMGEQPIQDSARQRIQKLSISMAERYGIQAPNVTENNVLVTFYTLVDFMTFMDEVHAQRYDSALTVIQKIQVFPAVAEEVDKFVAIFHSLTDEIRKCVPIILTACMDTILSKYKLVKSSRSVPIVYEANRPLDSALMTGLRTQARTLVTYCGLIPYFMNSDIYTKMLQAEVQMN